MTDLTPRAATKPLGWDAPETIEFTGGRLAAIRFVYASMVLLPFAIGSLTGWLANSGWGLLAAFITIVIGGGASLTIDSCLIANPVIDEASQTFREREFPAVNRQLVGEPEELTLSFRIAFSSDDGDGIQYVPVVAPLARCTWQGGLRPDDGKPCTVRCTNGSYCRKELSVSTLGRKLGDEFVFAPDPSSDERGL
jgi:hypothetical protein